MSGYFGDEATCRRCDYPRRLHDLLGVGHEYTPREENGPGAGFPPATEASENNPNPHEGEELMTDATADRDPAVNSADGDKASILGGLEWASPDEIAAFEASAREYEQTVSDWSERTYKDAVNAALDEYERTSTLQPTHVVFQDTIDLVHIDDGDYHHVISLPTHILDRAEDYHLRELVEMAGYRYGKDSVVNPGESTMFVMAPIIGSEVVGR